MWDSMPATTSWSRPSSAASRAANSATPKQPNATLSRGAIAGRGQRAPRGRCRPRPLRYCVVRTTGSSRTSASRRRSRLLRRTRSRSCDRGQQLLLQVDHHQRRALGIEQRARARGRAHAAPTGGSPPRRPTAACSSSRWPVKKWSAPGHHDQRLGLGQRRRRARGCASPSAEGVVLALHEEARLRAACRGSDVSVSIVSGKPSTKQRAHARVARSRRAPPSPTRRRSRRGRCGRPGKAPRHLVERGRARRPARRGPRRACPRCGPRRGS